MNQDRVHNADKKSGLLQSQSHGSPIHSRMLHNNPNLAIFIFEAMQFFKQLLDTGDIMADIKWEQDHFAAWPSGSHCAFIL